MKYVYACVVGIKAPESLCYLLMHLNPTLNKDYLLYVTRSLVLCVCFVDRCLSFCTFSLAIVLSVLYLQTLFIMIYLLAQLFCTLVGYFFKIVHLKKYLLTTL
jgi:hypothetical protein